MQKLSVMDNCKKYIDEHPEHPFTETELAELSGYSLFRFCHLFKSAFGISAGKYIKQKKLEKAAQNIASGMSITEAAARAGYETASGFAKAFRKEYGISASEYRKTAKK